MVGSDGRAGPSRLGICGMGADGIVTSGGLEAAGAGDAAVLPAADVTTTATLGGGDEAVDGAAETGPEDPPARWGDWPGEG
jgi:hypothetical protein